MALRRKLVWLVLIAGVAWVGYATYKEYAAWLYYAAGRYDRMMNPYGVDPLAPEPTEEDRRFHAGLFIADLHVDTLKWERDLLERSYFGHADVPRLMDGNVALQVFTIVTKSPVRMPWSECVSGRSPDRAAALAIMQGRSVFSARDRAYYQVERFKEAAARSLEGPGPELRLIETADDIRRLVADRRAGRDVIGGILGIEGGHWVGGPDHDEDAVKDEMAKLFEAGVRLFAPVHRFDNALSGSNEGCAAYGLTEQGRVALRTAEELGMVVDLAHISPAGLRDAAALLSQPFTVSHTGIKAECEPPCRMHRNLSDEEVALVLDSGGIIGIGFWPQAVGPSVWRIIDIMEHIMDIEAAGGLEKGRHIAFGSDYDGSVTPLVEVGHLDVLTALMRRRPGHFNAETIRDVAGRNVCRLVATVLPGGNRFTANRLCTEAESTTNVRTFDTDEAPGDQAGEADES